MVSIVPQNVQAIEPPSYLNYSRERKGSQAGGQLFEGLGQIVQGATTVLDEGVQNNIKRDVYAAVDPIRDAQGVQGGIANAGSDKPSFTPQGVTNAVSEVSRLAAANRAGKLSDTYYWGSIEAKVREIRNRYPGYREQIDQAFAAVTGTTPANALRRAVVGEFESAASTAEKQRLQDQTYVDRNTHLIPPALQDEIRSSGYSPESMAKARKLVGGQEFTRGVQNRSKEDMDFARTSQNFTGEMAQREYTKQVGSMVQTFMTNTVTAAGGAQSILNRLSQNVAEGKTPDPKDIQALTATLATARQQLAAQFDSHAHNPKAISNDPNNKDTFASVINDPTKLGQMKADALKPIDDMLDLIRNKEYGLATAAARNVIAMKDHTMDTFLRNNEAGRKLILLQEFGPQAAAAAMNTDSGRKIVDDTVAAIANHGKAATVTVQGGQYPAEKALDHIRDMVPKTSPDRPKAISDWLQGTRQVMTDPNVNPDAAVNTANNVFSQSGWTGKFLPQERRQVYTMMTSPQVTARLWDLRSGNPQMWENYRNWAEKEINSLARGEAAQIQEGVLGSTRVQIVQDPKTGFLQAVPRDREGADGRTIGAAATSQAVSVWNQNLQNINSGLANLAEIYRKEGKDPVAGVTQALRNLGIDTAAPREKSFIQKLWGAVSGGLEETGRELVRPGAQDSKPANKSAIDALTTQDSPGFVPAPGRAPNLSMLDKGVQAGLHRASATFSEPFRITSGNDGEHSGDSEHYKNYAVDIRVRDEDGTPWTPEKKAKAVEALINAGFTGIHEQGGSQPHIHADMRPGRTWRGDIHTPAVAATMDALGFQTARQKVAEK